MKALIALLGCAYVTHAAEPVAAKIAIQRGNQDWIVGMQTGDASVIAATPEALNQEPMIIVIV